MDKSKHFAGTNSRDFVRKLPKLVPAKISTIKVFLKGLFECCLPNTIPEKTSKFSEYSEQVKSESSNIYERIHSWKSTFANYNFVWLNWRTLKINFLKRPLGKILLRQIFLLKISKTFRLALKMFVIKSKIS